MNHLRLDCIGRGEAAALEYTYAVPWIYADGAYIFPHPQASQARMQIGNLVLLRASLLLYYLSKTALWTSNTFSGSISKTSVTRLIKESFFLSSLEIVKKKKKIVCLQEVLKMM